MWKLIKRLFGKKDYVDFSKHATELYEASRSREIETQAKQDLEFEAANELRRKKHAAYLGVRRNIVSYGHMANAAIGALSRHYMADIRSQAPVMSGPYYYGGLGAAVLGRII